MKLLNDIHNDPGFNKNATIICMVIITFFICDALLGIFFTKGLEKYYGLNTANEIALVGHSHLMLGVNKSALEKGLNQSISKYTREGVNIYDRKIMVKQLLKQNPNLKTVIYGVDAWSFTGEGLSENSYKLFYPFLGDSDVDAYVKKNADFGAYWLPKIVKTTRYNEGLISSAMRGYLSNWSNLKFGQVDTIKLKKEVALGRFRKINNSKKNIAFLRETLVELEAKNIQVLLLYIPTIDIYNAAEPDKFDEVISMFYNFEKEFLNVNYVSLVDPYSHDYSLFYDPIHMNPRGQEIITNKLIEYLK